MLRAAGDPSAAEESYHQGLAVAKRQSAKLWELLGATSLARLWRDQGKRTDARDLVARVYGWFTEGFDTPVLQEAKALLDLASVTQFSSLLLEGDPRFCHVPSVADVPRRIGDALSPRESSMSRNVSFVPGGDARRDPGQEARGS